MWHKSIQAQSCIRDRNWSITFKRNNREKTLFVGPAISRLSLTLTAIFSLCKKTSSSISSVIVITSNGFPFKSMMYEAGTIGTGSGRKNRSLEKKKKK